MVAPVIQKIAAEYKGKLLTVKVNVDQKPQVAARYNVSSIPTLMLFHQGKVLMRRAGAVPYEALKSEIDQHLSISGKSFP